jgi:hypothetical protein
LGGALGGEGGAASGSEAGAEAGAESEPSIISKMRQGKDVAQPGAQGAVRNAVKASAENSGTATPEMSEAIGSEPILKGNKTIVDDHLDALRAQEKAAYKQLDDTAGFDLKAEKAQLANDKYKLSQLGNTEADANARGNLIEAINDSEARIADAEAKLKAAGIDPKQADAIHQQRMAGMQFKKALVQNTSPDGAVNVDGLLNASKKLRFDPKFGDRLGQFFGSDDAADTFMGRLQQMSDLGASAIKLNKFYNIMKGLLIYEAGKKIIGSVGGKTAQTAVDMLP